MFKIFSCLIVCSLLLQSSANSEERNKAPMEYADKIQFMELDESDCVTKEGKLIALQNSDSLATFEVWVDRWFLGVQTPDHTKHLLRPGQAPTPLGCSNTNSGKQNWTLFSIERVQ